jgi:hypothetical protein
MKNPWRELVVPNSNYVLDLDRDIWSSTSSLPPQPYLGQFEQSKVLWLLGGFGTGDRMAVTDENCSSDVLDWVKRNLSQELPSEPNLWLIPREKSHPLEKTRDVKWWRKAVRPVHEALSQALEEKIAWERLASHLFILEAFPYPAKTRPNKILPSHAHSIYLLNLWIDSGRPILLGRAEKFWRDLTPKLSAALFSKQCIRAKNFQTASISPKNLCGGNKDFSLILNALLNR